MTDDAYDAQTLATSHRIERLHRLRFGVTPCFRAGEVEGVVLPPAPWPYRFFLYGLSDSEELIYSRAN